MAFVDGRDTQHKLILLARAREDLQEVIWELDPGKMVECPDGKERYEDRSAFKSREMLQAAVRRIKRVYAHIAAHEAEKAGNSGDTEK